MAKQTGEQKLDAAAYRKMGRYDGKTGAKRFAYNATVTAQHLIDAYNSGYDAGERTRARQEETIRLELEAMWAPA